RAEHRRQRRVLPGKHDERHVRRSTERPAEEERDRGQLRLEPRRAPHLALQVVDVSANLIAPQLRDGLVEVVPEGPDRSEVPRHRARRVCSTRQVLTHLFDASVHGGLLGGAGKAPPTSRRPPQRCGWQGLAFQSANPAAQRLRSTQVPYDGTFATLPGTQVPYDGTSPMLHGTQVAYDGTFATAHRAQVPYDGT